MPHDGFDEFWQRYPKKVGKIQAERVWQKMKPKLDTVIAALEWQVTQDQWIRDGGQYIPNPTTYLNQGRWLDEPMRPVERERALTYSEMKARGWTH